mmetsp:Transcript_38440/g.70511  ORF Transcript_38440/g.70511 Transcript_38440/m.70511 type:complete len:80 (-) Transcript_38440:348-587(-)
MFAKADATGAAGKALGKQLGIVAVPSFVLFRNGVRYGAVSMSKFPPDRLNKVIRDLKLVMILILHWRKRMTINCTFVIT